MSDPGEDIDFDTYIPALISLLASRLVTSASTLYRERFGLGLMEWRILAILVRQPGLSARDVGAIVGQDKAPISRALRELEKKDLVQISFAPKGNRHELAVTATGKKLYRASLPVARERESRLLQDFSASDRKQLTDFLKRLIDRTGDVAAAVPVKARPRLRAAPRPAKRSG
jgi:DNA-binding MarR family transcriptional regulator